MRAKDYKIQFYCTKDLRRREKSLHIMRPFINNYAIDRVIHDL